MPKYDEKTTQAIRDSIEHHKDNLHKLETLEGEFTRGGTNFYSGGTNFYIGDNEGISFNSIYCALCQQFPNNSNIFCSDCPLSKSGFNCNNVGSPWRELGKARTKEQAIKAEENMVKVLKGLLEETMSKYRDLECRIEAVTCWDKEGDDILNEIYSLLNPNSYISLEISQYGEGSNIGSGDIRIKSCEDFENQPKQNFVISFRFSSQPEKLAAFKSALKWLLNHSDIKPTLIGKEIDTTIDGKAYKVKVLKEADRND